MTIDTRYGKITASMETLNRISSLLFNASNEYERHGHEQLADDALYTSSMIFDILNEKGFYKK